MAAPWELPVGRRYWRCGGGLNPCSVLETLPVLGCHATRGCVRRMPEPRAANGAGFWPALLFTGSGKADRARSPASASANLTCSVWPSTDVPSSEPIAACASATEP